MEVQRLRVFLLAIFDFQFPVYAIDMFYHTCAPDLKKNIPREFPIYASDICLVLRERTFLLCIVIIYACVPD